MHRKYSTLLCRNLLYKESIEEDQGFKDIWLPDLKAVLDLEDLLLHLLNGFFCIHLIIGALRFSLLSLRAFSLSSSSSLLFAGFGLFFGFSFIFFFTPTTIMDSGNSSSMQSSSGGGGGGGGGGDEEYDSRPENISPFLSPSLGFGSFSNHPQQPPPPQHLSHHHQSHHHHPPTLLDPSAQNLVSFSHSQANPNPNALYNLDLVWPRGLRSELPNYSTDFGNLTGLSSSSSSSSSSQSLSSSTQSLLGPNHQGPFPSSSSSSIPLPSSSVDGNGGGRSTNPRSDHHQPPNVVKNSRKRTRASRRAPTTVLTTDTTNFRQMVQEFTGIPAPPFSAASPYSRRLDLFGPGAALRSAGGAHLDSLGPLYPFRPSAQKVSLLNTNMVDVGNNNPIAGPSGTFTPSPPSNNYQSDLGLLPKQPQNLLNLQNPVLSFQTLLQSPPAPPKYPQPIFGSKSQAIPSLDELGMSHHHDHHQAVNPNLGGFPTHGSSFDGNNDNGGGGGGGDSQNVTGYKLNCAASTSEFHPEKGLENVFLKD